MTKADQERAERLLRLRPFDVRPHQRISRGGRRVRDEVQDVSLVHRGDEGVIEHRLVNAVDPKQLGRVPPQFKKVRVGPVGTAA